MTIQTGNPASAYGRNRRWVVGESYGGMIAQYLAAGHPYRVAHTAVVAAAAEVSAWGKEVDLRMAQGSLTVTAQRPAGRCWSTCCRASVYVGSADCSPQPSEA